jgi:hypothetical protein
MEVGDCPGRDAGVTDERDDNDSPCHIASREGAKFRDKQPWISSLVLGSFSMARTVANFYSADHSRACAVLQPPWSCAPPRFTGIMEERP